MKSNPYSGYIRNRVAGLLYHDNKLLLVKLLSPITNQIIWIPPGGGVQYGETLSEALIREFKEETTLEIQVNDLVHINQIIEEDYHVIEHYYQVVLVEDEIRFELGMDPERGNKDQILMDIGFFNEKEIIEINVEPAFVRNIFDS